MFIRFYAVATDLTRRRVCTYAMMASDRLAKLFVIAVLFTVAASQICDNTGVFEILHSDVTSLNAVFTGSIDFLGDAEVGPNGISLASGSPGSMGGFFLKTQTRFQGDGGFSSKFGLQASSRTSGGEAWEWIIAGSDSRIIGTADEEGVWNRTNAFVVEFDTDGNSGEENQDPPGSGNHIAIYLGGMQICLDSIPASLADGRLYYVWVDYTGFNNNLEVWISSPETSTRPGSPTVRCEVDIWGTLPIEDNYFVGMDAYNSPEQAGPTMSLRETFTLADAYRPLDVDDGVCWVYAKCRDKVEASLCTIPVGGGQCSITACPPALVWDVSGSKCCAFVEKTSWRLTDLSVPLVSGTTVPCAQQRTTILYEAESDACD